MEQLKIKGKISNLNPFLIQYTKINSRWTVDLSVYDKNSRIKLVEKTVRGIYMTLVKQKSLRIQKSTKEEKHKLDFVKVEINFNVPKINRKITDWKIYLSYYI